MPEGKDRKATGRREFLKLASLGTVVGGASLLMQDAPAQAAAAETAKDGKGYQETPHVKAFYESTRF
ncbi:twin-arginine translocation signal domain-containing protein [Microbaculum sp. FT89]|uniref:twin-arginine translocation signal domain-containing protein n=1 Tax=Microbaculum sp. FT89 TaxID=3447298 RepID=UPI003F52BF49